MSDNNRIIGDVARDLAMQRADAGADRWTEDGGNNDVRGDLAAAILETRILADIQTLANAGAISPRIPPTGERVASGVSVDTSWYLTRDDLERVIQYTRRDAESKADYLRELTQWRADGRYTLRQAADWLEAEAGERYESILPRLKAAARNDELPMYEPERNQKLDYGPKPRRASSVRDFYEEAYWSDLNAWLEAYEPRIPFRFPAPETQRLPVVDAVSAGMVQGNDAQARMAHKPTCPPTVQSQNASKPRRARERRALEAMFTKHPDRIVWSSKELESALQDDGTDVKHEGFDDLAARVKKRHRPRNN